MTTSNAPDNNSPRDHRTVFLGRQKELAWLREAWEQAREGEPQMCILTAESGYGKTKIAQAFYHLLATEYDPDGYWPDSLLHERQDLKVMPDMSGVQAAKGKKIPWFWWGLRWGNPDQRNRTADDSFLTSYDKPAFHWHQESLLAAVHAKHATWKALFSAGKVALALFPGAASAAEIASAWSDIWELIGIYWKHADHRNRAEAISKSEEESIKRVLTTLFLLLDPKKGRKGSLPVVLLLDDAQWMDPLSLRIVQELWGAACKDSWPLLILGTHWQKEWNTGFEESTKDSFAGWIASLKSEGCNSLSVRKLSPLPETREILKCAFPVLTDEQVDFFEKPACGNPGHIAEIIHLLQRNSVWFENRDFSRPLNSKWKENLAKEKLDLVSLQRERFGAVEDALKELLGAASLQGDRFLRAFTLDVAEKLGFARDTSADPLLPAENPHALAEALDKASMEFRSVTICEAASDYLRNVKADNEISTAIASCTRRWIESGRLADLSIHQQLPLLDTSFLNAEKLNDRSAQVLFLATALQLIRQSGLLFYAQEWVARWEQLAPTADDFSKIEFDMLVEVGLILQDFRRNKLLKQLVCALETHPAISPATAQESDAGLYDHLGARGALEQLKAESAATEGDIEGARKHLENCVSLGREAMLRNGKTSQELWNLAASLEQLGKWEADHEQTESALSRYQEAFELHEDNWPSVKVARAATVSLLGIANCHYALGDMQRAGEYCAQVLRERQKLIEIECPNPYNCRDLSTAFQHLGRINGQNNEWEKALACFRKSLQLSKGICDRFGESPKRLADVIGALFHVGDAELKLNHGREALNLFEEALQLSKGLSDLRLASIALEKIGDSKRSIGLIDEAIGSLRESLDLCEQILAREGRSPQTLRDIYLLNLKLGDVGGERGSLSSAQDHFERCLDISEQIRAQFGDSPQSLRDLMSSHKKLRQLQDGLVLVSPSFDAGPRPNWQIPEVRRFVKDLFKVRPHLFYYLDCHPVLGQANMILMALLPEEAFKISDVDESFEFLMPEAEFASFVAGHLSPAIAFAERVGVTSEDSLERYSRMFPEETWKLIRQHLVTGNAAQDSKTEVTHL